MFVVVVFEVFALWLFLRMLYLLEEES